ncbi:hypothetical protein NEOLEDRAFT_97397 [Neolentinus lepideus HHB14362 ss-1]|uniref:Uncharacterized protein n=1 Tax=Neolentinus lepideus HHB14362 ss-1 TaxID=1314782 RepID=A0A165U2Z1_9AGAM|nr:hypothetical protein NEOLEDRAFT_97397 [Neolentinus lepideus HHB14362 ss-1]
MTCACYSYNSGAENYVVPSWCQGYPNNKAGYMSSPAYEDAYGQRQSVVSSRSDVDTPSSICSPPVYTPNPEYEYDYSDPPAIVGQDSQSFYDACMHTLTQCGPQPSTMAYSHPCASTTIKGQRRIYPSNYLPPAPDISQALHGYFRTSNYSAPTIDDLLSQQLYSSQPISNSSTSVSSSFPQAAFTFSVPPSHLSLTEVQSQPPVLYQPRPTRPIALLEDMKKAKFSLTEPLCEPGDLVSSGSCGAVGDLSQTLANTSLRANEIGVGSRSSLLPENEEEDEFDDGEDDSSEFEGDGMYEEPEQSSVPPASDSTLPLLCQPVSDEVLYQAQGSSSGWSGSTREYSSPELGPHGVTRSRQMFDEDEDVLGVLFGSLPILKRRRLGY